MRNGMTPINKGVPLGHGFCERLPFRYERKQSLEISGGCLLGRSPETGSFPTPGRVLP